MMSPLDTKIVFFGGAGKPDVIDAVIRLSDAGYTVIVAQHDPYEAPALRDAGLSFETDRAVALSGCQVVVTAMRSVGEVEDLYLGDNGLLELMDAGTYAIDLSFVTPSLSREIQAMAAVQDIDAVDAPLVNLGETEQPVLFVGGTPETREVLSPLFPYLGNTVAPQDGPGAGQFAALICYISFVGSLMGTVEAMALAHIADFPTNAAVAALASTAGGSRALVEYGPRIVGHDYSGKIKVYELLDALDVVLDAADDLEVTVPLIETAFQLYELLSIVGGEELNVQALALLYEDEQTCADYGLDWTLADAVADDMDVDGLDLEELLESLGIDIGEEFDDDDLEGRGGRHRGPYPPIGGFFSRN